MSVIEAVGQRHFVAGHGHVLARPALFNAADYDSATGIPNDGVTGYATGCFWQNYLGTKGSLLYLNVGDQDSAIWVNIDANAASDLYAPINTGVTYALDLTDWGLRYAFVCTMPAGCIVRQLSIQIASTVVAGGTTAKLSLGDHTASPVLTSGYPQTADLLKNTTSVKLINTLLAADTPLDLCGTIADGSALGDTAISAGSVNVSVYLTLPALLPAVL